MSTKAVPVVATRPTTLTFDLSKTTRVEVQRSDENILVLKARSGWVSILSSKPFRGPGAFYVEYLLKGWPGGGVGVCEAHQSFSRTAHTQYMHGQNGWSHDPNAPWVAMTNGSEFFSESTMSSTGLLHFSKKKQLRVGISIDYFLDQVNLYIDGKKILMTTGIRKFAEKGIHAALSLYNEKSKVDVIHHPEIPEEVHESHEKARQVQEYLMRVEARLACKQRKLESLLSLDDPSSRLNEIIGLKRSIAEDQEVLKSCDVGNGFIVGHPDINIDDEDEDVVPDIPNVDGQVTGTNPTN